MSLVIRLSKTGKRGEAKYRVVVKEKRSKREGNPTEVLGWYNKTGKKSEKKIDKTRYEYWISKGALPSPTVKKIVES